MYNELKEGYGSNRSRFENEKGRMYEIENSPCGVLEGKNDRGLM